MSQTVDVDLYDRDQYVDGVPHEAFARLRREAPAHWNDEPDGPGFWAFTRYAEVVERSLVHRGVKHYFLVEFPQEPGALRRFLDDVLGPDDDIVLFEYVKRDNRETGAALTGVELGSPSGLPDLLARMDASPLKIQHVAPGTTAYRFLI